MVAQTQSTTSWTHVVLATEIKAPNPILMDGNQNMTNSIDVPYHRKAYVCIHVFDKSKPVLLIDRTDGDWSFLCGQAHADNASMYRVVGIGHVINDDPSLAALLDLPANWEAERGSISEPWIRTPSIHQNASQ